MRPGDVFVLNAPYNGGTHLPDVTVIAPVFLGWGIGDRDRESARPSRSSTWRAAATTPTSAASRPARCRRTRRTSTRKGCCSTTCNWSRQADSSKRRCGRSSPAGRLPGAQRRPEPGPTCARRLAACAKGAFEHARMADHFTLAQWRARLHEATCRIPTPKRRCGVCSAGRPTARSRSDGQRRHDPRRPSASTRAARVAVIGLSPARARSSRPTSTRLPPRCARRRCCTCSHAGSTTRSDERGCLKPLTISFRRGRC